MLFIIVYQLTVNVSGKEYGNKLLVGPLELIFKNDNVLNGIEHTIICTLPKSGEEIGENTVLNDIILE